ncbi:hypothetical protein GBAR_LOCUS29561, partial [Geodia barretti]
NFDCWFLLDAVERSQLKLVEYWSVRSRPPSAITRPFVRCSRRPCSVKNHGNMFNTVDRPLSKDTSEMRTFSRSH